MTPRKPTLRKYGLTEDAWHDLFSRQGSVCAVCRQARDRYVIDHEHCKGWGKLPPAERVKFVRGVVCWQCNSFLIAKNTASTIDKVFEYLAAFELRRRYG